MSDLVQHHLIQRVHERCTGDERLIAALMYGSFVRGEGDEFSDVEFWLFNRRALGRPYTHSWQWARSLLAVLQDRYAFHLPDELIAALDERVARVTGFSEPVSRA